MSHSNACQASTSRSNTRHHDRHFSSPAVELDELTAIERQRRSSVPEAAGEHFLYRVVIGPRCLLEPSPNQQASSTAPHAAQKCGEVPLDEEASTVERISVESLAVAGSSDED